MYGSNLGFDSPFIAVVATGRMREELGGVHNGIVHRYGAKKSSMQGERFYAPNHDIDEIFTRCGLPGCEALICHRCLECSSSGWKACAGCDVMHCRECAAEEARHSAHTLSPPPPLASSAPARPHSPPRSLPHPCGSLLPVLHVLGSPP